MYDETEQLCREYASCKGPGTQAIPERHQFFKNLGTIINRISEKCERENGMIYHQKLPAENPIIETKAMHGLAEPDEYNYPQAHSLWTQSSYDAFNLSKAVDIKDKGVSLREKSNFPL